jgi:hypothetical protein
MPGSLPKISLAALPSPPAPGSVQMFDGYFPALPANSYQIVVKHSVQGQPSVPAYSVTQDFIVQAPEFFIDTTIVQNCQPPDGNTDVYGQRLPFVVLSDPALPWERSLVPDGGPPDPAHPTPWMALVIFAEGEISLLPGTNNPVWTNTVGDLLASDANTLKPQLPASRVSADVLAAQCQTIKITGATFNAVMPSKADLPYLAHCQGVSTLDEGEVLQSVLLCNRFPTANRSVSPAAPMRYYAHLVSLEGFADYLGSNAQPIPSKPGSQELMDVQLASLYHWSFVSLPLAGMSFEQLVTGLIQSEQDSNGGALALPVPVGLPAVVQQRLQQGYAPLTFAAGSGEQSFAWYRGPLTPTVAQPIMAVGNPPVPLAQASCADELMIYLAEQGLFDLSLAAAWNIGRNLALADASFAQNVNKYRVAASQTVGRLAQRMSLPHLAGQAHDPRALLAHDAARRSFTGLMGDGLGAQWHAAVAAAGANSAQPQPATARPARSNRRALVHPSTVLALPGVAEAVSENLSEIQKSVAGWLAALALLEPVPFSHLVPDPRMLPVESIRFFYLDPNWIDALTAGASSIAIQGSADAALHEALLPSLTAAVASQRTASFHRTRPDALPGAGTPDGAGMSGMLIRSQLISGWPQLVVTATLGGAPINIVRNETLAPNVRLCLFDGIPDTVTLAEPYQGLLFGIEDNGIVARCVTAASATGMQLPNVPPVPPTLRPGSGNVLDVQATATALAAAVGVLPFASGALVQWNGQNVATTFVSPTQLSAQVPASLVSSAGSAQVTVQSGGATSLPLTFIIDEPLEIDAINPAFIQAGGEGFALTVSGAGFAGGAVIQWNGAALPTTVTSLAEATATVAADLIAAPGSAAISVLVNGSTSNSVSLPIVSGDPVIDAIRPNVAMAGSAGLILTVSGFGFTAGSPVMWNGQPLRTTFVTSQQLTAVVPPSSLANAGSASVTVAIGASTSNAVSFTIAGAAPTIGFLQPSVAIAGGQLQFQLTVDGVNFAKDAQILWNGTALPTQFDDAEQLIGKVPPGLVQTAGTVSVTVSSGGATSTAMSFMVIVPQPSAGLLQPASVVAGSGAFTLTVTGGFGAGDFALQMIQAPEEQNFPTT